MWWVSAVLWAFSCICIRKLYQSVHYLFSPYYLAIAGLILCIILYIFDDSLFNLDNWDFFDWLLIFGSSISAMIGQLLFSLAFKYSPASSAAPMIYPEWVFNMFTDILYFQLDFFFLDLVGAVLITIWLFLPVILLIKQHYLK